LLADLDSLLEQLIHIPGSSSEQVNEYLHPVDRDKVKYLVQEIDDLRARSCPTGLSAKEKRSWTSNNNRDIGLKYEEAIRALFENSEVLSASASQRTVIGEIDVVFTFLTLAPKVPLLQGHTTGLGEAKCHQTNLKSEWVTEMSGNFAHHSVRFGIIFPFCSPKKLGVDTIQALKEAYLLKTSIIPFGRGQFNRVLAGESFLKVLAEQDSLAKTGVKSLEI